MKASQITLTSLLLIYTVACTNNNHTEPAKDVAMTNSLPASNPAATDTFPIGKVISSIVCKSNPAQSYTLYIPSKGNKEELPVVYFFDPHANGTIPVSKYKNLADSYGYILIGSNNSKNGDEWSSTENIWHILSDDSQKRLKINTNRIYTCGFSGGAKVASYLGLNHNEVRGVIANGAGLPEVTLAGNFHFSITAIAGDGDMNMTDLVSINNELDKTQTRHRIIFFDGKHEWAPENTMNIAFAGLQFDAMIDKLIPSNDAFINSYVVNSKKRITDYSTSNNYIKAETECKLSFSLLDGLTSHISWFTEKEASIKSNPVYQRQLKSRQNILATEQHLKELYTQQFQQGDMNFWNKTIIDLQTRAKIQSVEGDMYQRLLAYLSLAFYSISNQLISGNQNMQAQYYVDLYKKVDETNSEAWYFSAMLNARNKNADAARDDLLKAVAFGFTDKNRLHQQAEFQNPPIDLNEIESKMKTVE